MRNPVAVLVAVSLFALGCMVNAPAGGLAELPSTGRSAAVVPGLVVAAGLAAAPRPLGRRSRHHRAG